VHQLVVGQQHQAARLDRQLLGQRLDIGADIRPTSPTIERSMYFGGFIRQRPGRLAPSPLRDENLAAVGLTPVRLGAYEPVRQRGAGACGTVDCCHEREGQTHSWEAPTDGTARPADQGAIRPQLTIEPALPGRPRGRPVVACSPPPFQAWGFTGQPPPERSSRRVPSRRSLRRRRHRSDVAPCRGMKMRLGGSVRARAYGPAIRDRGLLWENADG
jgi:hypothetical protein